MERMDDLQYKGLRLIQDSELFSFGTDAVLLAGFCDVGRRDRVLDMGTGTGILPVLLSAKNPEALMAVELQTAAADLARRNMELNGICCDVVTGDMREAYKMFSGVTAVVCNPPYDKVGSGKRQMSEALEIARHEVRITIREVCEAAGRVLGTGGRLYMVHRAARTADVICAMRENRLEPKRMRFVTKREREPAGYVLIKAVKDGKPRLEVEPPVVVYGEDGQYTDEMNRIYHRRAGK